MIVLMPNIVIMVIIVIVLLKNALCFCQISHSVLCRSMSDIRNGTNDTTTWRHVQIGNSDDIEPESDYLDISILTKLHRTRSLTIIKQLKFIKSPLSVQSHYQLRYLNLYGNTITTINDRAFAKIPNLEEVYMRNNQIELLGDALFQHRSLEIVDLSNNKVVSIYQCFMQSKIKIIMLNNNRIESLSIATFPNNLEQLELNNNRIKHIASNVFSNLQKLKELFLEHNHFTDVPDIIHLKSLQYLHLASNNIAEVYYNFKKFNTDLAYVDLRSNQLRNVSIDMFASVNSIPPTVLLSFNRLTNITFAHPAQKTDLVLYGNPWNCDCWFRIEKVIQSYQHMKTCDINFDDGNSPFCIQNGDCNSFRQSDDGEVDDFLKRVRVNENRILKSCIFRL